MGDTQDHMPESPQSRGAFWFICAYTHARKPIRAALRA